jgi:hypothetical protein
MQRVERMFSFLSDPRSPSLPSGMARRVVVSVIGALLLSIATTIAIIALLDAADWWRGLVAASVASIFAAGLSLVPLLWGVKRNLNATVAGYFVAMAVRPVVSLGIASIAVFAGHYPSMPTLLLTAIFYIAVLAVEALVVAGAAWSLGRPVAGQPAVSLAEQTAAS